MNDLEKYLIQYFGIGKAQISEVADLFEEETLTKGVFFNKKESVCSKLSFLKEGFIRMFDTVADKEITQWIGTKGYFITDVNSFYLSDRSRWNIHALTDCTLYTVSKANYNQLEIIVPNWLTLEKQFITHCFATLENRVFSQLSLNAKARFLKLFNEQKELFNVVPLKYLASMLGITPETLSRIRAKHVS